MKLTIRIVDDLIAIPGKKGIVICDEQGEPLPQQYAGRIEQVAGDTTRFTATFYVDGEHIRIVG